MTGQPSGRLNMYLGPKRQLLGHQAARVPPAWKANANGTFSTPTNSRHPIPAGPGQGSVKGSKIFLSKLPPDVRAEEVEELFKKTVGPLKDCFIVYNDQGNSKGMAVVAFTRPGDAAIALNKFNGKIVDGRRPLKIEIIVDTTTPVQPPPPPPPPQPASLLTRLSAPAIAPLVFPPVINHTIPQPMRRPPHTFVVQKRVWFKKGPKRIQKIQNRLQRTKAQLDQDMDDYRARAGANV